jgi:hypothetical protein
LKNKYDVIEKIVLHVRVTLTKIGRARNSLRIRQVKRSVWEAKEEKEERSDYLDNKAKGLKHIGHNVVDVFFNVFAINNNQLLWDFPFGACHENK